MFDTFLLHISKIATVWEWYCQEEFDFLFVLHFGLGQTDGGASGDEAYFTRGFHLVLTSQHIILFYFIFILPFSLFLLFRFAPFWRFFSIHSDLLFSAQCLKKAG